MSFGFGFGFTKNYVVRALAAWSPLSLFSAGEVGVWFDPSDMTTLFQDAAGTTPVTALEQQVGLMLDKSKGLVLGSELVVNGDGTSLTSWTNGNSWWSVSGGRFYHAASSNYNPLQQGLINTSGLRISFDYEVVSGAGIFFYTKTDDTILVFTLTGTGTYQGTVPLGIKSISFSRLGGYTATFYIDNISVRELPGYHASQSTAASKPVLSARKNWLLGTETLATQSYTTLAGQMVLSFYGTGTVTLSGTSTAGPLVGTGVADRVSLTFTPTAGSLTLTVSGSVTRAQLEYVQ